MFDCPLFPWLVFENCSQKRVFFRTTWSCSLVFNTVEETKKKHKRRKQEEQLCSPTCSSLFCLWTEMHQHLHILLCKLILRHTFQRSLIPTSLIPLNSLTQIPNQLISNSILSPKPQIFYTPACKSHYFPPLNRSNPSTQFISRVSLKKYSGGSVNKLDKDKVVEEINLKFAKVRVEIEMTLEIIFWWRSQLYKSCYEGGGGHVWGSFGEIAGESQKDGDEVTGAEDWAVESWAWAIEWVWFIWFFVHWFTNVLCSIEDESAINV